MIDAQAKASSSDPEGRGHGIDSTVHVRLRLESGQSKALPFAPCGVGSELRSRQRIILSNGPMAAWRPARATGMPKALCPRLLPIADSIDFTVPPGARARMSMVAPRTWRWGSALVCVQMAFPTATGPAHLSQTAWDCTIRRWRDGVYGVQYESTGGSRGDTRPLSQSRLVAAELLSG